MSWHKERPLLIIISGPSGVGKDAAISKLKQRMYSSHQAITVTTRPPRSGEKEGQDYYFLSETEFQQMVKRGELLEWAKVYGQWYGIPHSQIEPPLAQGQDVILRVDVQGASTLKRLFPDAVLVFLAPPSTEELLKRLKRRNSDSCPTLNLRLETAQEEMKSLPIFDYVVVNYEDMVEAAVSQLEAIITAEKCRVTPR